jgi:hypothetical protein
MKRNARLVPVAKVALIALAVTGAAGLTGCTAESSSTSSLTTSGSTTASDQASPSTSGQPAGACPVGTYDVATLTGKQSVDVQGQQVTFGGTVSGLSLTMDDATWKLTGDNAKAKINVAGITALDATINGTASGTYAKSGSQYQFVFKDSSGTATVALGGLGSQQLDLDAVADAIAPRGSATIDCTPTGATIDSDSVTLDLKRTTPAPTSPNTPTPTPTTTTTTADSPYTY